MKRRWKWLGASVLVLAAGAGLAAANRTTILSMIARAQMPPVEDNRAVTWAQGPQAPAEGERPPNVVFILADDLGYNDITINGGGVADGAVPTPNIDSIGQQGVVFAAGYAGNATCANAIRGGRGTGTSAGFTLAIGAALGPPVSHARCTQPQNVVYRRPSCLANASRVSPLPRNCASNARRRSVGRCRRPIRSRRAPSCTNSVVTVVPIAPLYHEGLPVTTRYPGRRLQPTRRLRRRSPEIQSCCQTRF